MGRSVGKNNSFYLLKKNWQRFLLKYFQRIRKKVATIEIGCYLTAPVLLKLPVYKSTKLKSFPKMKAVRIFFQIRTSGLSSENINFIGMQAI